GCGVDRCSSSRVGYWSREGNRDTARYRKRHSYRCRPMVKYVVYGKTHMSRAVSARSGELRLYHLRSARVPLSSEINTTRACQFLAVTCFIHITIFQSTD